MSDTAHPARIVLVGLSGTGKSAVARLVAERLGWTFHDTDADVVAGDGRAIDRIFAESGEPEFRRLERAAVAAAAARRQAVIATGGGAPLDVANRAALWAGAFVVELQARPETAVARMTGAGEGIGGRPMLGGDDPRARLERLRVERGPIYALADWTVRVDGLDAAAVAEEVVAAWERHGGLLSRTGRMDAALSVAPPADPAADDPDLAAVVDTPGGRYAAYAGWEILGRLPRWLRAAGLSGVAHVVADRRVANLHGQRLLDILAEGGFEVAMHAIDLDESRKSLDAAEQVFDELVADRAERKHTIIAFGGGVATDLGGFVAATYLRGLPLVHISTSLLGMVDAAIGGKVAVNHRAGKNLIGAFYQPRLVVADAALLQTLPRREFLSGWAEVIKHALIMDTELLGWLERDAEALLRLEPEPTARVLRRSMALKAQVVSADEREDGVRMTLNYGHTIGHALEAASGYEALLHGEAVAIGMAAAADIGQRMGLIDQALVDRQNALIRRFELPLRAPGVDPGLALAAMKLDKKVVGKAQRFILLDGPGRTVIRADVPAELVQNAVAMVTAP